MNMKRRNVQTLSLVIVTFTYLLVGAAIFDALEGTNNENALEGLIWVRDKLKQKYNINEHDYLLIETLIQERKSHKSGPQWKFAGSFYFALVVLALIGYGHSTPATKMGKAVTVGYAMVGIPMAMIMFQSIGERMNKASSVVIKKLRTWAGCVRTDATELDLIAASGFTSGVCTFTGAVLYHTQEGWSYFDSLYYCFITLTTIGFGDFVALQQGRALHMKPYYVACSFIFLLLGLASVASSVNLLVLKFMTISLEEEEEGNDEMTAVADNVVTLEGEVRCTGLLSANQEKDNNSVCSCTCYSAGRRLSRQHSRQEDTGRIIPLLKRLGFARILAWLVPTYATDEEGNFYDSETQSISNYAKLAVKRSSF